MDGVDLYFLRSLMKRGNMRGNREPKRKREDCYPHAFSCESLKLSEKDEELEGC